eukprot:3084401-Amphidinium_carterae.2
MLVAAFLSLVLEAKCSTALEPLVSKVTVQLYLHDVPASAGGATTFLCGKQQVPCQPSAGCALLFTQDSSGLQTTAAPSS